MGTYLVTGGCGFIGSHLVEALLAEGQTVRVLDDLSTGSRDNLPLDVELIIGDVGNLDTVVNAMQDVDGCFHLAAIASVQKSTTDWSESHTTNLTGAINVFDATRQTRGPATPPVVYASSAAVYGDNASMPLAEDATCRPLTAYGADKLGCEQHARVAGLIHQIPTAGFRFFNVYGPRQDPFSPYSGVISIFASRILNNEPVTVFGDGQQVRDFIYVGDVVNFLMQGMKQASVAAPVYNACTGAGTSIIQLARTLAAVNGSSVAIEKGPVRAGDIQISLGDNTKAREGLGITATVPLGTGLKNTLDFLISEQDLAA